MSESNPTAPNVVADEALLDQIFAGEKLEGLVKLEKPVYITQNQHKCVFRIVNRGKAYIVRLTSEEKESHELRAWTTTLQAIARLALPTLVPHTLMIGTAHNAQDQWFHYSVNKFIEGQSLDNTWEHLSTDNQRLVVAQIIMAQEKLHILPFQVPYFNRCTWNRRTISWPVGQVIEGIECPGDVIFGSWVDFAFNGQGLLKNYVNFRKAKNVGCILARDATSRNTVLQSPASTSYGQVGIHPFDVEHWRLDAVLCHNDLNPPNIILRRQIPANPSGDVVWKLAGIVNWKKASFVPSAYELTLLDAYLGVENQHLKYYLLMKEHMKALLPNTRPQTILADAMKLIFDSQQHLYAHGKITAADRQRFLRDYTLSRSGDTYGGWISETLEEIYPAIGWTRQEPEEVMRAVNQAIVNENEDVNEVVQQHHGRHRRQQSEFLRLL
ncbi:hypothetical protein BJ878DRAFT_425715 [Calycina marina]|uniref:PH domain-containing protein n=1 Tax=Calycina marina TaxID=1763456 RepID=A0A9P7YZE8_9HELO|nr:hypothetical protein BJ878DRAFT_425715 [Calycina marina]